MTQPDAPKQGLASAVSSGSFDVAGALGGRRGVLESVLPGLLFVVVFSATRSLTYALWTALGIAGALSVARLAQRQSVQQALGGLVGVGVCAFIAGRTGRAEDFYLPGLLINVAYAAGYFVSILVRWPLLGVLVGPLTGEGWAWRRDPARLRAYSQASWVWVVMFLVRLAVQYPLYQAQAVGALGVARVAMGFPLFGLAAWISWLILRRVPLALPDQPRTGAPPPA